VPFQKRRKVLQLGELVIANGADILDPEILTGALLVIADTKEPAKRESRRNRGVAFFRGQSRADFGGKRRHDIRSSILRRTRRGKEELGDSNTACSGARDHGTLSLSRA
jgi:Conjugal transfer protein TraD